MQGACQFQRPCKRRAKSKPCSNHANYRLASTVPTIAMQTACQRLPCKKRAMFLGTAMTTLAAWLLWHGYCYCKDRAKCQHARTVPRRCDVGIPYTGCRSSLHGPVTVGKLYTGCRQAYTCKDHANGSASRSLAPRNRNGNEKHSHSQSHCHVTANGDTGLWGRGRACCS